MVTGLAVRGDSLVVVQYGRHDPQPQDSRHLRHETVDVYSETGTKLFEGLEMDRPILVGGDRLYVLSGEPPAGWIVTVH